MNEDNLNLALLNNDLWNENLMLKKENDELRRMNNALSVVGREKSPILGMYIKLMQENTELKGEIDKYKKQIKNNKKNTNLKMKRNAKKHGRYIEFLTSDGRTVYKYITKKYQGE